ncbi:MAG: tRNA threonylcarbamoyladenosine biosynthesis protein TsaE [Gammaproteobacteria bacterium]|jgi:tRNA threonylcarbamoyladenosine biosynthesis protein TsaE
MQLIISTSDAMEALGKRLANFSFAGMQIFLSGELGTGKTTLVRGFLHGFGYSGKVKSPTYTLVESYSLETLSIFHFDFYRISDPEEVESMGYREYPAADAICLIEWPEKAYGYIGEPDLLLTLEHQFDSRIIKFTAFNQQANALINNVSRDNFL